MIRMGKSIRHKWVSLSYQDKAISKIENYPKRVKLFGNVSAETFGYKSGHFCVCL